jgi:hypothetical protein
MREEITIRLKIIDSKNRMIGRFERNGIRNAETVNTRYLPGFYGQEGFEATSAEYLSHIFHFANVKTVFVSHTIGVKHRCSKRF